MATTDELSEWSDEDLIEELDENGSGLTAWETEFLERMTVQVKKNGTAMSLAQRDKLIQIVEERCDGG